MCEENLGTQASVRLIKAVRLTRILLNAGFLLYHPCRKNPTVRKPVHNKQY